MFPSSPPPPSSNATDPKSRYEYADSLCKRSLLEFARVAALELVDDHPKYPGGYAVLVEVAWEQSDFVMAMSYAMKGIEQDPLNRMFLSKGAAAAARSGFNDVADRLAKRLVEVASEFGPSHLQYADVLERLNRGEESLEQVEISKRIDPDAPWHLLEAKARLKLKQFDKALELLEITIADDGIPSDMRIEAGFVLTKLLDKQGAYDEAWAATQAAHRLGQMPFNRNARITGIEKLKEDFSERNLKLWQRPGHEFERGVFVLGMPRSGTSLMEQILQMHPEVGAVGELSAASVIHHRLQRELDSYLPFPKCLIDLLPANIESMQAEYTKTIDMAAAGKTRVINKCLNTYEFLGMLSVIMPGLRAIHIKRHPLDNLLSCHTTNLLASGHTYTSKLEDLALMYQTRQQLAEHWGNVLDIKILELSYEQLTADQENQSRRMLEFLGLEWDPAVLDFHKSTRIPATISYDQVGKKMYTTSVARWRNYEKHLGPLVDALGDSLDGWDM